MADFPGLTLTDAGREIQAKAQTGQTLEFTRVGLGDGSAPESIVDLSALVNELQTLSIQRQQTNGDGTAALRVILTNKGLDTGFFMRELGLFARDPDTQEDVLYGYTNAGERPDWLPAAGGATVVEQIFDLITVIGSADNVTAVIDDYITIALKSEVDALRPFVLPKGGTAGQMLEKSGNAAGAYRWLDPKTDGMRINFQSVEEPRTAVANQRTFTLQSVVTNGLAVYINGVRLPRGNWSQLSATQLRLNDPLNAGDRVLFVQNEEMGTARALDIALDGPTLVYPGSDNTYTLTAFDAFAKMTVATTLGTVTRSGAAITLSIPAEVEADTLDLTVTRDNVRGSYRIAVGDAAIATPEITYPVSGDDSVGFEPDLTATGFTVYPAEFDTHATSRWQIATDEAFESVVFDSEADADNLTAISIGLAGGRLESAKRYYVRVQYAGETLTSPWSQPVAFNTADVYVRQPRITQPTDGAIDMPESPAIIGDAFSIYGGESQHVSSDWQVLDVEGALVWESLDNADSLESVVIPVGILSEGRVAYSVRVRYRSADYGISVWSPSVSFVTPESFIPTEAGQPYQGGYFVSTMEESGVSRKKYMLIVSPRAGGVLNTASHSTQRSAARNATINGYSDWSLPSVSELEVMYNYFKPTNDKTVSYYKFPSGLADPSRSDNPDATEIPAFRYSSGPEYLGPAEYWSDLVAGKKYIYKISFRDGSKPYGGSPSYPPSNITAPARLVRRVYL